MRTLWRFLTSTPRLPLAHWNGGQQINQQVLRQIGVTIRNYEREQLAERSKHHEESHELHPERRLPDSRPEAEPAAGETPGKYGRTRKSYLKEHRPILYNQLLMSEKLYPHLLEIDETAQSRLEQLMPQLAAAAGATEQLKASDPMKWVGLMNTCKAQAEEILMAELFTAEFLPLRKRTNPNHRRSRECESILCFFFCTG